MFQSWLLWLGEEFKSPVSGIVDDISHLQSRIPRIAGTLRIRCNIIEEVLSQFNILSPADPSLKCAVDKSLEQIGFIRCVFIENEMKMGSLKGQVGGIIELFKRLVFYNLLDYGETYLKWKLSSYMCDALDQSEVVLVPSFVDELDNSGINLFGGQYYNFQRRLRHYGGQPWVRFCWDMINCKKAFPPMSDNKLLENVHKTAIKLTTIEPDYCNDAIISDKYGNDLYLDCSRSVLEAELDRTVDEIYPIGWCKDLDVNLMLPSISAHYGYNRMTYGALGCMLMDGVNQSLEGNDYIRDPEPTCNRFAETGEVRTYEIHVPRDPYDTAVFGGYLSRALFDFIPPNYECASIHNTILSYLVFDSGYEPMVEKFWRNLETIENRPNENRLDVQLVGLKEPCKIRVISTGPCIKYYKARYIQKLIHSRMRQHPTFQLIGGADLNTNVLSSVLPYREDDEFYVSGDYEAATNNIRAWASRRVAERIGRNAGWSEDFVNLFVDTLVNHHINLSPSNLQALTVPFIQGQPQVAGQLMGSPTSFPVLCLINAAGTRHSLELGKNKRLSLKQAGFLINGDDVGFVCNSVTYKIWSHVMAQYGLVKSMGKNYTHKDYFMINTMLFHCERNTLLETATYSFLPYVNFGLLCGNNGKTNVNTEELRDMICPSDTRVRDLSGMANDLIDGFPYERKRSLLKRFIKAWEPLLKRVVPQGCSYFLPKHLGGLGLPVLGHFNGNRFSYLQRKMAAFLDRDVYHQNRLMSVASITKADSAIMHEQAQRILDTWRKDAILHETTVPTSDPLLSQALARVLSESREIPGSEIKSRYDIWKKKFLTFFKKVKSMTYPPLTDYEITSSQRKYQIDSRPLRVNSDVCVNMVRFG